MLLTAIPLIISTFPKSLIYRGLHCPARRETRKRPHYAADSLSGYLCRDLGPQPHQQSVSKASKRCVLSHGLKVKQNATYSQRWANPCCLQCGIQSSTALNQICAALWKSGISAQCFSFQALLINNRPYSCWAFQRAVHHLDHQEKSLFCVCQHAPAPALP